MTQKMNSELQFNNTYLEQFPDLGSLVKPTPLANPEWVHISEETCDLLQVSKQRAASTEFLNWFAGSYEAKGSRPFAQKYTGHQFGQYNPDLGDGRGLLLGEIETDNGRFDLHVKGAGQTPYSRFGDGRAVLRSSIREYLASEALFHLGIPTSRALGVFKSSEQVQRETLEQGAALIRVCESHVRFGHFEYAFYQNDETLTRRLVDYTVRQVLPQDAPEIQKLNKQSGAPEQAYAMFKFVIRTTAEMVAKWQAFGFCHGVMNTDNMSILGITFDYGPYGFLDEYNPKHICNHSDYGGRYAFDEQPGIALWNLNALGYALSLLLSKEQITELLRQFEPILLSRYSELMRQKLGLKTKRSDDRILLAELLELMAADKRDYTNTFRLLSNFESMDKNGDGIIDHFINRTAAKNWLNKYQRRLSLETVTTDARQTKMKRVNPKFILRNYLAQQAIEAAERGDNSELDQLMTILKRPFAEQTEFDDYAKQPPDWSKELTVSCSS